VSDSSKAIEWSVYFHHIKPLTGEDGALHATRRCFRTPDERGVRWDEEVIGLRPPFSRVMRVYDLHGMAVEAMDDAELVVQQILEPTIDGRTRLTFRTQLAERQPALRSVLFFFGAPPVRATFEKNLENIARAVEMGDRYTRRHAWVPLAEFERKAGARADAREALAAR
jgi:hypothetical protein